MGVRPLYARPAITYYEAAPSHCNMPVTISSHCITTMPPCCTVTMQYATSLQLHTALQPCCHGAPSHCNFATSLQLHTALQPCCHAAWSHCNFATSLQLHTALKPCCHAAPIHCNMLHHYSFTLHYNHAAMLHRHTVICQSLHRHNDVIQPCHHLPCRHIAPT